MSYTKGVWVVDDREDLAGKFYSDDATGSIIGECQHYHLAPRSLDERKANAKRIVDCVNACDGMESPADEIAKLRKERDELLRVMIEIKADCDEASSYGDKVCVATLEIDRVIELCGGK